MSACVGGSCAGVTGAGVDVPRSPREVDSEDASDGVVEGPHVLGIDASDLTPQAGGVDGCHLFEEDSSALADDGDGGSKGRVSGLRRGRRHDDRGQLEIVGLDDHGESTAGLLVTHQIAGRGSSWMSPRTKGCQFGLHGLSLCAIDGICCHCA